jgi:hypothetical protein
MTSRLIDSPWIRNSLEASTLNDEYVRTIRNEEISHLAIVRKKISSPTHLISSYHKCQKSLSHFRRKNNKEEKNMDEETEQINNTNDKPTRSKIVKLLNFRKRNQKKVASKDRVRIEVSYPIFEI